jgi:lysophospholipase L1-like esterase
MFMFMKKGLFVLMFLPVCFWVRAQNVAWDSTYRPGGYDLKVGLFESYPNSEKDVVFLGNSITAGVDWEELLQLPRAKNRGISGDITFGVLQRLSEVTEGHPAKVFVLIGINDISRNIPDSVILYNYGRIMQRLRDESPRTKVYFQTLLPVNGTFTQFKNHYNKDEHIAAVNEGLKKIAERYGVTVIDLHAHFMDSAGRLDAGYTADGLHLNAKGYAIWKGLLQPYLK